MTRTVPDREPRVADSAKGRFRIHGSNPNIRVLFIAGFGPIVREATASRKLYSQTLAIPFKKEKGGNLHTEAL
jgi:hypothetical protein